MMICFSNMIYMTFVNFGQFIFTRRSRFVYFSQYSGPVTVCRGEILQEASCVCYVPLYIPLFPSIRRGTWQSTLWLWTSTTCSSSTPACCTNGASSLPQASSALWVHFPPSHCLSCESVISAVPCQSGSKQEVRKHLKYCSHRQDEFSEHLGKVLVKAFYLGGGGEIGAAHSCLCSFFSYIERIIAV